MANYVLYKDRLGETIAFTLTEENGSTPINLTSATVLLKMYSSGNNTLKWSHSMTVVGATAGTVTLTSTTDDFSTAGVFYTLAAITYTNGNTRTEVGPTFEVIENEENSVTPDEFLDFIDIPSENAKKQTTIKTYLEEAETLINMEAPSLNNTTNSSFIKLKRTLIKMKGAILYFMNSDENFIDPNQRLAKLEFWTNQYNLALTRLQQIITSDPESGAGLARRCKHTDYNSDSGSYLAEDE